MKTKMTISMLVEKGVTTRITKDHSIEEALEISAKRVEYVTTHNIMNSGELNNNPLVMTSDEKKVLPIYGVYGFVNFVGEIVYVGSGDPTRATDTDKRRKPEVARWLISQLVSGRNPVVVYKTGMLSKEAKELENEMIYKHQPKFNKQGK